MPSNASSLRGPIVEARDVTEVFPMPSGPVTAVRDVSLRIDPAEYVAIWGPSGCGKSTLMHILGCVDTPSSGALLFEGRDVSALPDAERSDMRLAKIGFVFQRFFLLPMLTAWENVELPQAEALRLRSGQARVGRFGAGAPAVAQGFSPVSGRQARRERTAELLEYVGLAHRAHHRPSQLSGGEMQRVAIARALANRPVLLLADEPTGELDRASGEQIADLFDRVQRDGTSIVIVTHDQAIA